MKTRITQSPTPNPLDRRAFTKCASSTQITAIDTRKSAIGNSRLRPDQPPFSSTATILRISLNSPENSRTAAPKTANFTCAAKERTRLPRVFAFKKRDEMQCENRRRSISYSLPGASPHFPSGSLLLRALVPLWFIYFNIKAGATHRSFHTTTRPRNRSPHVLCEYAQTSPRAKWPPATALASFQHLGRL